MNVVCVHQQMLGAHPLDHEVAALALRRFHQIDVGAQSVNKYMLWWEVLEPDFSVSRCSFPPILNLCTVDFFQIFLPFIVVSDLLHKERTN